MATIDVEALLDATAKPSADDKEQQLPADLRSDDREKGDRDRDRARDGGSRDGDGHHHNHHGQNSSGSGNNNNNGNGNTQNNSAQSRHGHRRGDRDSRDGRDGGRRDRKDHSPTRSRSRRGSGEDFKASTPRSDAGSSHKSRRRSRSRDDDRRHSRRHRDGDYYRGGRGRSRTRSRSPPPPYYRRDDRDYRDRDRRDRGGGGGNGHGYGHGGYGGRNSDRHRGGPRDRDDEHRAPRRESSPQPTEDERDRRTVFVQQLAARLRTRELKDFFETVGPVNEAQIVKDRISGRSKGVGYVEFKTEEYVAQALQLTGQKLLGIPVIVQLTEAEKNRQVRTTDGGTQGSSIPFHRLYVGNIHFNVTEQDLRAVFEPFGKLEFVQLQKDDSGRSRGYGFVQYEEAPQAREALERMNGFDLAGRPIRVGLGNDKFTPESTANLLQRFSGPNQQHHQQQHQQQHGNIPLQYQGSAFSGAGGRGGQSAFDRAGGRENEKSSGASALDDTDVAGVNFNNFSRDALMRKLARTDEQPSGSGPAERPILKPKTEIKPLPVNVNTASRCVVLHNMFDPEEEEGESWVKELEDEVRQEAEAKYGHVVHIAVDPNSKGDIYLKFDKVQGGENAIKGLNGRYFGGRMIDASPVVDAVYSSLFSRTRAV